MNRNKRTINSFFNKSSNSHLDSGLSNTNKTFEAPRDGTYTYKEKGVPVEIKESKYEYEEYSYVAKTPLEQRLKHNQESDDVFHESDLNYTKSKLDTTKDGTRIFASKHSKSDFMGESFMNKALIDDNEPMDSTDEIRKSLMSDISRVHRKASIKKSNDCCCIF